MGRMAMLAVMGFNIVFMVIGFDISQYANSAYTNYTEYYSRSTSRNIAASAANMAGNAFFQNPGWTAGYPPTAFQGGTYSSAIDTAGLTNSRVRITSTGTYNGVTTPIVILLEPSYFCNFGYYVDYIDPGGYFATGDTIDGPFHTQSRLNCIGQPVFTGKVTAKNGLHLYDAATNPIFMGGFQSGVNIALPTNMNQLVNAATAGSPPGAVFGKGPGGGKDLWMTFNTDGTVTYERKPGGGGPTTVSLATLAPNGTILCESTNVHLQGTLSGRVTIACSSYGIGGKGQVFLEDDIKYASGSPPAAGVSDWLGVVSEYNMIITDGAATPASPNIELDGAYMSLTGGLYVDHYNSRGNCGAINLKGSLTEKAAQWTGTVDGGGHLTNGFNERIMFDKRFTVTPPPFFPTTGSYKVISWYE